MYQCLGIFVFVSLASCNVLSLPNHDAFRKQPKFPSNQEVHAKEPEHNAAYDHEAFLGDEADVFDNLTPDESQRRLGYDLIITSANLAKTNQSAFVLILSIIFDKIDGDKDGFVNSSELTKWIQLTQRRYLTTDVQKQWKIYNPNNKEKLSWEDYKRATYGFLENEARDSEEYKTYSRMLGRDRRRWLGADQAGVDALSIEEFENFLHPEDVSHMHDIVVQETIEDIDKNDDGKISQEEYISDLYRGDLDEEEPHWVQGERDTFSEFRDTDKDGFLTAREVMQWIMPKDYDHAGAESAHLIHSADMNRDAKLTKQEVLDKYDLFVGSQATNFGEALTQHEEF